MSRGEKLTYEAADRMTAELFSSSGAAEATRQFNQALIEEFRENGGVVRGEIADGGMQYLLLTLIRKSNGRQRTVPLTYVSAGDRLFVVASKGGHDQSPLWYHSILANPEVTVEVGRERFGAIASVLAGDERDEVFSLCVEKQPLFGEYQAKTERTIPVVELVPADATARDALARAMPSSR